MENPKEIGASTFPMNIKLGIKRIDRYSIDDFQPSTPPGDVDFTSPPLVKPQRRRSKYRDLLGEHLEIPEKNEQLDQSLLEGQHILEALVFIIIMIVAIVGNIMVLLVVFRNPKMRTVTNYFVANLAFTDILYVAWTPFIFTTRITKDWVFGESICKLVTYMQFVSGVCSIFTMMLISIERYLCVCATTSKKLTMTKCLILISFTWVLSLAFPIPVAVSQVERDIEIDGIKHIYCGMSWSEHFHVDIYLTFMIICFFVFPLAVISWNYIRIFKLVRIAAKRTTSIRTNTREHKHQRQVRLTKMFIAIVCLFVIMWLPFFVLSFLAIYLKRITSTQFTITIILSSANTCQNPIMYGYFNTKFRREFKRMCKCFLRTNYELDTTYTTRDTNKKDGTVTT